MIYFLLLVTYDNDRMFSGGVMSRKTKIITLGISLITMILLFSCTKKSSTPENLPTNSANPIAMKAQTLATDSNGMSKIYAILKTAKGNITLKFYPTQTPNTVTRIIELIQSGFYDGQSFHRVVPGFVIQTGDPTGSGSGGSGKKIAAEANQLKHVIGTVAMAHPDGDDNSDSQFYIALATLPHLDGKYTVFGQVTEGIDILPQIAQGDKIISMSVEDGVPLVDTPPVVTPTTPTTALQ